MDKVMQRDMRVRGLMKWATKKDLGLIIECLCHDEVVGNYRGNMVDGRAFNTPQALCDGFGLLDPDLDDGGDTVYTGMTPVNAIIYALKTCISWGEMLGAVIGAVGLWSKGDRIKVLPVLRKAMAYVAENGCDS